MQVSEQPLLLLWAGELHQQRSGWLLGGRWFLASTLYFDKVVVVQWHFAYGKDLLHLVNVLKSWRFRQIEHRKIVFTLFGLGLIVNGLMELFAQNGWDVNESWFGWVASWLGDDVRPGLLVGRFGL